MYDFIVGNELIFADFMYPQVNYTYLQHTNATYTWVDYVLVSAYSRMSMK